MPIFAGMKKIVVSLLLANVLWPAGAGAQRAERLQPKPGLVRLIDGNLRQAVNQYKVLMGKVPADRLPRSFTPGTATFVTSDAGWWTSGFYCATLFYLYGFSHDTALLNEGERRLKLLEKNQYNKGTHDLGFMMYCPYGNLLKLIRLHHLPESAA